MSFRSRCSLKVIWILLIILFTVKLDFVSTRNKCRRCEDCLAPIRDNCFCELTSRQNGSNGEDVVLCKNVVDPKFWEIPILQNIRSNSFEETDIQNLTRKYLFNAMFVDDIHLNNTNIEEIQSGSFSRFFGTKTMHLRNNKLSKIKRALFHTLIQLTELDLHSNQIHFIRDKAFYSFHSLENLNLADNKLSNLSSALFIGLNKLKTLNISKNSLTKLETNFSPSHLTTLDISYNNIHELPENLFSYQTNLKVLNISKTDISSLNLTFFRNLSQLHTLSMHSLKLKKLNVTDFVLLPHLKNLDIHSNNLKFVKDILNFCPLLENISIDGNEFLCTVVESMLKNSKRRNVTIQYTPNYQDYNIEGIQCTKELENVGNFSINSLTSQHDPNKTVI